MHYRERNFTGYLSDRTVCMRPLTAAQRT